jgi:hypothetical protein
MVIYEVTSKNIGLLVTFMNELKVHDKRNGNYNPNNYNIDKGRKLLELKNADCCVVEKLGRKYNKCKICKIQI